MRSFGRFQVLGELGRGGAGRILRARDPALGREVALKLLLEARGQDPIGRARLLREAQALARLRHPHVVASYGVEEAEGCPALVLDLIEGPSLEEQLRRQGPLGEREAAWLGRCLADALQHAHERGVVHRDVKPGNVLLEGARRPLLTDFGLTRRLDPGASSLSQEGQFLGSPGYWAPEQARGDSGAVGPASDIFGLGATLYAALTGRPPFPADSLQRALEVLDREAEPARSLRPELSPALDDVLARCLRRDPAERPASAAAVREALDAFLAPPRRRPGARAVALLGLLLLGGAGALVAARVPGPGAAPDLGSASALPADAARLAASEALQRALTRQRAGDPAGALRALEEAAALAPDWSEPRQHLATLRSEAGQDDLAWGETEAALRLGGDGAPLRGVRALLCLRRCDPSGARREAEQAVALAPEDGRGWRALGRAAWEAGDGEGALEALGRALALQPDDAAALAQRAWARIEQELIPEAGEDAERLRELWPTRGVTWAVRAELARRGKLRPQAEQDLSRGMDAEPTEPLLFRVRARLQLDAGRLEQAAITLERALALEPWSLEARLERARVRRALRQLASAAEDFRAVLEARDDREARRGLAICLGEQGRLDEAEVLARQALALEPERPACLTLLATVLLQTHPASAEAEQLLRRALEIDPSRAVAWELLAGLALQREDWPLARQAAERALALRPSLEALTIRASARDEEGDPDGALADYAEALRIRPGQPAVLNNRATLLLRLGRPDEARLDLERAVAAEPRSALLLANLALVLRRLGLGQEAGARAEQALALDPTQRLALLERGLARLEQEDLAGAVADAEAVLEQSPLCPEALLLRARARARRGDLGAARADLQALLALPAGSPITAGEARALLAELEGNQ